MTRIVRCVVAVALRLCLTRARATAREEPCATDRPAVAGANASAAPKESGADLPRRAGDGFGDGCGVEVGKDATVGNGRAGELTGLALVIIADDLSDDELSSKGKR